jgi:hypothetical protein
MELENFVFYGSFKKTIDVLPEQLGNKVLRAIINYGTAYELPKIKQDDADSAIVYAIMQTIIPNIEAQKQKYENGSNGGRPIRYPQEDFDILFNSGFTNSQIIERLGCSEKTVERRRKIWTTSNGINDKPDTQQEDTQQPDIRHEKEESVGFDGFDGKTEQGDSKEDNDFVYSYISDLYQKRFGDKYDKKHLQNTIKNILQDGAKPDYVKAVYERMLEDKTFSYREIKDIYRYMKRYTKEDFSDTDTFDNPFYDEDEPL